MFDHLLNVDFKKNIVKLKQKYKDGVIYEKRRCNFI